MRLVYDALRSQDLFYQGGTMVTSFEREFAEAYAVPYAIASTSGTAAIHVALGAIDLNPGDEVITAPITDAGTIIPILYQSGIPVFADIDSTYNMDPADVRRKITPRTRAIIAVHLFGNPCDMDALSAIAREAGIPLIEDCSQAHMTRYRGQLVGTIGDIGCFSFQQSKHMTTGDGGMTITSNKAYAERMRLFADKGFARKGWGTRAYLFLAPNYRMNELTGAVGRAQLGKVAGVVAKRAALGAEMTLALSKIPGVIPAPITPGAEHAFWLYPVLLEKGSENLESVARAVVAAGFKAFPGYTGKPIYLCTEALRSQKTFGDSSFPFRGPQANRSYEYKEGLCPRAEETLTRLLCLPWDESWSSEDIRKAAGTIARSLGAGGEAERPASAAPVSQAPKPAEASVGGARRHRIGIVGCGDMGRWHFDCYRRNSGVSVVAFADTNLESAQSLARLAGGTAYSSHTTMLEKEKLDAVSICTTPSTHRQIAIDFLNAGVDVLCEKPLTVSASDAKEMYAASEKGHRQLIPAFKFRFAEEVVEARRLIGRGVLGKISSFRLMFGGFAEMSGRWFADAALAGGGVIMDNGPHAVDLVRHLLGEIESVSVETANAQELAVEDTAKIQCRVQDGVIGTIDLSWSLPVPSKTYLEIYGDGGTCVLDLDGLSYRLATWSDWKRLQNHGTASDAFQRQIDHFVGVVAGAKPSVVDREDGPRSQAVIEAAYESLRRDGSVRVEGSARLELVAR
ncbi:MAG: DegT/DnrJ/EryC1/StrS family aminotransferase [Acidobacteriota bacterium]|nr:DegT/DnrJ/EryC1/StrS family aminotransferase [Acidobacteriota bacterium]